ncbi:MAG: hypothetical protein H5T82_05665 [Demequina sp.]|uniref:hypothetical protein n=1 Tax=Demequina sp. TaxID=2050685 RepID=UPI00198E4059|nr:hypothetical protein [Demequina sp.]MBC7298364.1 hypothetical protein [Demequina sp.]
MISLSDPTLILVGSLFLAFVTIESGGWYLTRVATGGHELTEFQKSFHRAGHGHAGMFVTLGIVAAVVSEATDLTGAWLWLARSGIAIAGIVMPAGFFFSSLHRGATMPNRWMMLVWLGAALFAASAITLGVGLLRAT